MLILHSANKNNYTKLQVKILHSIVRLSTRRSMEGPKKLQNVILKNFRRQNRKKKLLFQKLLSKKFFFYYWYPIRYTNMLLTEHQVMTQTTSRLYNQGWTDRKPHLVTPCTPILEVDCVEKSFYGGLSKLYHRMTLYPECNQSNTISEHDEARKESLGHATSIIDMISLCLSRVSQYALIAQRIEKTLKYAYQVRPFWVNFWPVFDLEWAWGHETNLNFSITIWIFNLHYH